MQRLARALGLAELATIKASACQPRSGLLWVRRSKTDPEASGSARYLPRGQERPLRRSGRRTLVQRIPRSGSRAGRSGGAS